MAVPGLPTGALGAAASAVANPLAGAGSAVAKAFADIATAVKAVLPVLDTLGDKFKELGGVFKDTFRTYVGEPLLNAVKAIGGAIKFALPTDVLDGILNAFNRVGTAVGSTAKALLSMAGAAGVMAGAAAAFGVAAAQLVAKANPAVAEQFNFALNDMLAVIGQALMPVLQVATQIVRLFADAMLTFSTDLGGALGTIASSLMPIFEVLVEVFARVGQVVAEVLKFVAPMIRLVAEGIRTIFEWIGRAVRYILDLIGIEVGDKKITKGASVGAAVRTAGIGSVESVLAKAYTAAFSLGTASGANYQMETANNTASMVVRLGSIAEKVGQIFTAMTNPLKFIDDIRDIGKVKEDIKRLEEDLAPGGFYDPAEFRKRAAARTPEERERMRKFFEARSKAGDGGGTVKPDGP